MDECLKILQNKLEAYYNLKTYSNEISISGNRFPDKPLIAFMGNTVNNIKDEGKNDEVSDIAKVVHYFAELNEEERKTFQYVFNGHIKGKLALTRNKYVEDEILLSYGDGDYWGIINVGNGENFLKQIEHEDVIIKPPIAILEDKYLFKNIDKPQCPINVLIGSRKFAEGWNCFRVSVIGLINLGTSKGNKIIQIFGRGVRLKGLNNDGKRKNIEHIQDYNFIMDKIDENSLIKKT
ncbi:hypothetical protein [Thermobrachium celere]|uniref:hypothetical protein n=1 Tax=Thermobrachium celere TaxID=53422 RepID=UPI00194194D7|nr:hypothetical protein [Thermobrachium celere]GFR36488.1 hypothetical protein TCEA9_23000 [Thermobrachium celere]